MWDLLDREGKMKMWLIGIVLAIAFACMFINTEVTVTVDVECVAASEEPEEDADDGEQLVCKVDP